MGWPGDASGDRFGDQRRHGDPPLNFIVIALSSADSFASVVEPDAIRRDGDGPSIINCNLGGAAANPKRKMRLYFAPLPICGPYFANQDFVRGEPDGHA